MTNGLQVSKDNISEEIKMAIQVNGKTRDIVEVVKDLSQKDLEKFVKQKSKANKYLTDKNVKKIIFRK